MKRRTRREGVKNPKLWELCKWMAPDMSPPFDIEPLWGHVNMMSAVGGRYLESGSSNGGWVN